MKTNNSKHELTIPASIGVAAMDLIMQGEKPENAVFMSAIEYTNACYDREFAKKYGLENWAKLSSKCRNMWDHCFGRENRLPGFLTRDNRKAHAIEEKILVRQENRYGE